MLGLRLIRYALPAVVTLAGIVLMLTGGTEDALEGGGAIVGAGLSIWLMNVLWRVGVSGDADRDDESDARAFFDAHGHWPDEVPPAPYPGSRHPAHARHPEQPADRRDPRRGPHPP